MRSPKSLSIAWLCLLLLRTPIVHCQSLPTARTRVGQLVQVGLEGLRDRWMMSAETVSDEAGTYYVIEGMDGVYQEVPAPDESMYESSTELDMARRYTRRTNGFIAGVAELSGLRRVCSTGAIGIFVGCSPQFLPVTLELGFPLTYPRVTPEKFTPELLSKIPQPKPLGVCCRSAIQFQESMCACDPETITAMKNMGIFDPEQTVPLADYVYGQQCGARTFLAEECPNGSPFEILRQS